MGTASVYRALLAVRGGWLLLEWLFGWGSSARAHSFTLLHPYASLFVHAVAVALSLGLLAGLWFFRRWARLLFVALLVMAVVYSAFRPYQPLSLPPPFVVAISWCMVMLNGVIVAMSFLAPVRDLFATET